MKVASISVGLALAASFTDNVNDGAKATHSLIISLENMRQLNDSSA